MIFMSFDDICVEYKNSNVEYSKQRKKSIYLPIADVQVVNCGEYFSVKRIITSICSRVSCTASLYCASQGTYAAQN